MLIVEYQSKSYQHYLNEMSQIADHKTRFLITFNGADAEQLQAAAADLLAHTQNQLETARVIAEQASAEVVGDLFSAARSSRNTLVFTHADLLFDKRTAVKGSHERESRFDLNNLFKNIAKHNGIVVLATENRQTLSAAMSTKVDVVVRFTNT